MALYTNREGLVFITRTLKTYQKLSKKCIDLKNSSENAHKLQGNINKLETIPVVGTDIYIVVCN